MAYDRDRDPAYDRDRSVARVTSDGAPARDWYTVSAGMVGAKELPRYARAIEVTLAPEAATPVTLVVVPIGEPSDTATRSIPFYSGGPIPRGIRRLVSIAGGMAIPAGVQIDLVTE